MTIASPITSAINSKLSETTPDILSSYDFNTSTLSSVSSDIDAITNKVASYSGSSATGTTNINANGVNEAPTKKTTNNGRQETKPPSPPTKSYLSEKGKPQTPPTARSDVKNTQAGKTNKDLVHVCDFTIALELEVCGENFKKVLVNEVLRMESLAAWGSTVAFPFLDEIKSAYRTIKAWYDMIKQYLDIIKEFIKCVQEIIAAISQVISFIVSLPASVMTQAIGCVNGFANILTDAVQRSVDGIKLDITSGASNNINSVGDKVSTAKTTADNTPTPVISS